jgi:hypothetical protein
MTGQCAGLFKGDRGLWCKCVLIATQVGKSLPGDAMTGQCAGLSKGDCGLRCKCALIARQVGDSSGSGS